MSVGFYLGARQVAFNRVQELVCIVLSPEIDVQSMETLERICAAGIVGGQLPFVRYHATRRRRKGESPRWLCLSIHGYCAKRWKSS